MELELERVRVRNELNQFEKPLELKKALKWKEKGPRGRRREGQKASRPDARDYVSLFRTHQSRTKPVG